MSSNEDRFTKHPRRRLHAIMKGRNVFNGRMREQEADDVDVFVEVSIASAYVTSDIVHIYNV